MYTGEVASEDFVLLKATWPIEIALGLVERMSASHVIIHFRGALDFHYLYPRSAVLDQLRSSSKGVTVHEAFGLQEQQATETRDAYTDAEEAPDCTVVLDEGRVIGFLDSTVAPLQRSAVRIPRGGDSTSDSPEPQARSLQVEFPERVALNETASLLVTLAALAPNTTGLPVALPAQSPVDIVVQPQKGFTLAGKGEARLMVVDEQETLPVRFPLKADMVGQGRIRVLAFHDSSPLGALVLAPTVVAAVSDASFERNIREQEIGRIGVSTRPDLQLLILEDTRHGKPAVTIRLTANDPSLGLHLKPFGPVELRTDPLSYFQQFFEGIENLPLRTAQEWEIAKVRLGSKGLGLFNAIFPDDVKLLLWELREQITTIEVESEEPWIPWELCKLEGKENGRTAEGPFLCQAYAMTRWIPGIGRQPLLSMNNIGLVVPADSNLPGAPAERDYMLSLAGGSRKVTAVPASFLELRTALASGRHDVWHFTGHGLFSDENPNRSGIQLEGGHAFTPDELSGEVKNLGRARPLVFLNACQVGRSAMSLTDIGGFAPQFLRAGAAAFVGSYWSVSDQPAVEFAKAFYDGLLAGMPIGRAARSAREKIRPLGDPTWLAYTVFADPSANVATRGSFGTSPGS